jgi:hypothetical protein
MGSWSAKRKFLYGGTSILVLILVVGGLSYALFYHAPTCSDGRENGDETGIDCGGSCKLLCTSDALAPIVLWSKIFPVSGDLYTAVAFVQNPNINSKNPKATYQFQIFDANKNLIATKNGETSIPKNKNFAVFEVGLVLKGLAPKSAEFSFISLSPWQKDMATELDVFLTHSAVLSSDILPRITGRITNNSFTKSTPRLELSALIFDENENVIGASRTFVDTLGVNTSQDFVFTWQKPFALTPSFIQIIYRPI